MKTSAPLWQADYLYLCLKIDQFSAQALIAYNTNYKNTPFVVIRQDAESHKSLVFACSPRAREMNIYPGTPVHFLKKQHKSLETIRVASNSWKKIKAPRMTINEIANDRSKDRPYFLFPAFEVLLLIPDGRSGSLVC